MSVRTMSVRTMTGCQWSIMYHVYCTHGGTRGVHRATMLTHDMQYRTMAAVLYLTMQYCTCPCPIKPVLAHQTCPVLS